MKIQSQLCMHFKQNPQTVQLQHVQNLIDLVYERHKQRDTR